MTAAENAPTLPGNAPHGDPARRLSRPALGQLPGVGMAPRGVLHLLEELADDRGHVVEYIETIAGLAEIAPRLVSKYLAVLEVAGAITRQRNGASAQTITVAHLTGAR